MTTIGDKAHTRRADWERIPLGIPSSAGVRDPEMRRCLDAMTQNVRYMIEKFKAMHSHAGDVVVPAAVAEVVIARVLPTITTQAATVVTATTATLNGLVVPTGASLFWYFEYGTTTAYGSTTTVTAVQSVRVAEAVAANITGLTGGMTYHFRLVGLAGQNTIYGEDAELTTITPMWTGDVGCRVTGYPSSNPAKYGGVGDGTTIYYPGTLDPLTLADCDQGMWNSYEGFPVPPSSTYYFGFAGIGSTWFYNVNQLFVGIISIGFFSPSFVPSDGYPHIKFFPDGMVMEYDIGFDWESH